MVDKSADKKPEKKLRVQRVAIKPPRFAVMTFTLEGTAPLVIHRFAKVDQDGIASKMEQGGPAGNKKNRDPKSFEDAFNAARYRSPEGWDGFNASAIRKACISACRLVNYKMTIAKLSIFAQEDGHDADQPQVPLVRIYGEARMQQDIAVVDSGAPYVTTRAAYFPWSAQARVRFDLDQFTPPDLYNLMQRVGLQVGLCEGRPDSKNSAGMDWGLFHVTNVSVEPIKTPMLAIDMESIQL